jgi:WD40 repeat protein
LSADAQHLLVSYRTDTDTYFEVWSLESGEIVAEMSVAGVPALISIDASAVHLATADFDRAVRIWNLRDGEIMAQIDLDSQPSEIRLSANGESLGVLQNQQGVSLWRTDRVDVPLIEERGDDEWHMAFSPSGARFLAGNLREGLQVFDSADGTPSGPLVDPGLTNGSAKVFRFGGDESVVVTAGLTEFARFWTMPVTSSESASSPTTGSAPAQQSSTSAIVASAIAPGGEKMAFGDRSGHVHIQQVESEVRDVDADADEISFLGHRDAVLSLVFSDDGALIASAGADGSIRVWDAHSGLPRPFYGKSSVSSIERIIFSPSASQLAVLGGQRVWLMDAETGMELANVDLGEVHSDLAFLDDGQLFLTGSSGTLRNFYADRTGNWHLRTAWSSSEPIRNLDIAPTRQQIVLVDERNQVTLLDPRDGRVGSDILSLPEKVDEVEFSPNESRVLFKTGRWIHRAIVAPTGLIWTDTVRAPKSMQGSRMVFNQRPEGAAGQTQAADQSGDRVFILTNDTGSAELAEIRFSYSDGPAMFGSKASLLREWNEKLHGSATNAFVREGF